jgi:hypothetical protein
MKRYILLFIITCCIASISAYANTNTIEKADSIESTNLSENLNHSAFFLEAAVGFMFDQDYGSAVGVGYRKYIKNGIHWDIVKVGINGYHLNLFDPINLQVMTGIRYNSPRVLMGKSVYVTCAVGCYTDFVYTGFAYEIGTGVNLNKTISLGILGEGFHEKYNSEGVIGIKVGIQF